MGQDDWAHIGRVDVCAFGVDRLPFLRRLASDGITAIARTSTGIQGYGFARQGFDAGFLGPIVAKESDTARSLIGTLLQRLPGGQRNVYWDLLPGNHAARELAESLGFQLQRRLTRMRRGAGSHPESVDTVFATSGFETG